MKKESNNSGDYNSRKDCLLTLKKIDNMLLAKWPFFCSTPTPKSFLLKRKYKKNELNYNQNTLPLTSKNPSPIRSRINWSFLNSYDRSQEKIERNVTPKPASFARKLLFVPKSNFSEPKIFKSLDVGCQTFSRQGNYTNDSVIDISFPANSPKLDNEILFPPIRKIVFIKRKIKSSNLDFDKVNDN
ncbi:unnamed protein product [Blepharisma stoltei]|uniref:Uncharacterized protein n=1 Tax=Blepharisma stoltei TaxID=1481888 RepID=A0AAU9K5C1_9CILI|nr:unnamed protein product [Blepharisma stoltei]